MTTVESYPLAPAEVTAEWLTRTLRAAGFHRASVRSVATETVGVGVGFVGQVARITPEYEDDSGAPATFIGKFPAATPGGREIAAMYGLYRAEVNFYEHVAAQVPLRTPRRYFSAVSDDATEFLLLLEDLEPTGRLGDQVGGCSLDDARLALRNLARFHAAWWGRPELEDLNWLPMGADLGRMSMSQAYPAGWRAAIDQYGHLMSPAIIEAAPELNERMLRALDQLSDLPLTIMHADYRLDNMFFGYPGCDYDLAVVDWQIANRGWAAYDVAYFIGSNLETDVRRAHEDALLREYHGGLCAGGVGGYAFEAFREDYRRSMSMYLATMIGNFVTLDTANERGVALFELIFRRVAAAVDDLRALEALP